MSFLLDMCEPVMKRGANRRRIFIRLFSTVSLMGLFLRSKVQCGTIYAFSSCMSACSNLSLSGCFVMCLVSCVLCIGGFNMLSWTKLFLNATWFLYYFEC
ncbi:unnamed protein product [Ilex paraguariensis]|uniref:Uncharacterized protein n=1 Tax=Ilex paraguariensis TaxID=185542 RepID=A0ABC8RPX5_9AQUA